LSPLIVLQCGQHGLFVILDLHAAPGGQNIDWHSDAGIHKALFWEHVEFKQRVCFLSLLFLSYCRACLADCRLLRLQGIHLWEELARRYKDNTWVAGCVSLSLLRITPSKLTLAPLFRYNLLNEPTDPEGYRLEKWYDDAEKAVRAVDPDHILFLDGVRCFFSLSRKSRLTSRH
jgi:hypothetical protein